MHPLWCDERRHLFTTYDRPNNQKQRQTQEEHDHNLSTILQKVRRYGITLKKIESTTSSTKIRVLGFQVRKEVIKSDPKRTRHIQELPPPQDAEAQQQVIKMSVSFTRFSRKWVVRGNCLAFRSLKLPALNSAIIRSLSSDEPLEPTEEQWAYIRQQWFQPANRTESDSERRARLVYQSRKRGNLENGILLSTFADEFLDRLNSKQLAAYDSLINQPDNDWDIYYWATGAKEAPEFFRTDVLKMLQEHVKNEGKTLRNQQPPLKPRSN